MQTLFFYMVHQLAGEGFWHETCVGFASLDIAMVVELFVIDGFA